MINILIVGAGQLGSRHLQGALLSSRPLAITVVDPSSDSLAIAKLRADEIKLGNALTKIVYMNQLQAGGEYEVCIVATTAEIRFSVFKQVITVSKVKNIIFEKVLFQKESEYFEVEKILASRGIMAWVNCPRRVNPTYIGIRQLLANASKFEMEVFGEGWGMACNSIHFIDLFGFLTGSSKYEIDTSLLSSNIKESKRAGAVEVFGQMSVVQKGSKKLILKCEDGPVVRVAIKIITDIGQVIIDEAPSKSVEIRTDAMVEKSAFQVLFQSQLSNRCIDEILVDGTSSLTPYVESMNLHLPFIVGVKNHIGRVKNTKLKKCPIT